MKFSDEIKSNNSTTSKDRGIILHSSGSVFYPLPHEHLRLMMYSIVTFEILEIKGIE